MPPIFLEYRNARDPPFDLLDLCPLNFHVQSPLAFALPTNVQCTRFLFTKLSYKNTMEKVTTTYQWGRIADRHARKASQICGNKEQHQREMAFIAK